MVMYESVCGDKFDFVFTGGLPTRLAVFIGSSQGLFARSLLCRFSLFSVPLLLLPPATRFIY